ncbi:HAMP domain-containing sensor histidine kinase [Brevibacillus sp. AY1]|uniref:sensor histidine kinase n=1 Tax=Brevibacillus sp. AY1 TaxID=2807621 RepID=UPI002454CF76|nr:HAMP domain-containing sensor histidine kinase [Brevibacillus sp. AY1]MDH4619836.1 HAMP domain-containing histidine kinase [Brevibacillus sp. AY1]
MKIKKSIMLQIFFTILSIFLLVFVLQFIFFGKYFTSLYSNFLLRDIRAEFQSAVDQFSNSKNEKANSVLSTYAVSYDAPVLAFTEDYSVIGQGLFNYLSILTVRVPEVGICRILISGLNELPTINLNDLLTIEAVRVGESNYFEPYSIRSTNKIYLYRQTERTKDTRTITATSNWYTENEGSLLNDRARIIYDLMKDCLIERKDIKTYLAEITKEPFTDKRGTSYYIISESRRIDGVVTYFVTIRPIVVSNSEVRYFSNYFYTVYCILGILLIAAVFILSRKLSAPIVRLSTVTSKLASKDFSVRANVNLQNEVGQLSESINVMADNLQAAMEELQQSAEVAKVNEKRMKLLLADLAHEFKTPLGIISLYSEVIENGMFEKEPAYYFGIIEQEIENLTQMIDETIQLSKLEAGYWEYKPAPLYISDLIEGALSRFSEKIMRENFTLKVDLLDAMVFADGRRIEQVLTNLISNALKYSSEKKVIEVRVTRENGNVKVRICNDGYISEQDINHIWERYYRASEKTTARLPSEGIGLEIVKHILIMHNSNFEVRQEADMVCFYFTIPLVDE